MEVADIERVKYPPLPGRVGKMFVVCTADHFGFSRGDNVDSSRAQASNYIAIHGVFVDVQTNPAQATFEGGGKMRSVEASSAAMSESISARLA